MTNEVYFVMMVLMYVFQCRGTTLYTCMIAFSKATKQKQEVPSTPRCAFAGGGLAHACNERMEGLDLVKMPCTYVSPVF